MAGGKQTARQKMINLMYLVFIAMMALNIDREVLRAFDDINTSLEATNTLSTKNNDAFISSIAKTAETDDKYKEALDKSNIMKSKAKEVIDYVNKLKSDLNGTEAKLDANGELNYKVLSDMENVTRMFFISDSQPTQVAKDLETKIKAFNDYLKSIGKDNLKVNINGVKKGNKELGWLYKTFYGQPQVAATTTLTKIQNDVINAESEVIRSFLSQKVMENVEINEFKGVISSPGFVQKGTQATTYAAIGAFDNRLQGSVTVNNRTYPLVDGKATIPLETGSSGTKSLSGSISFTDAKGGKQTRPLETVTYEVVEEVIKDNLKFTGVITADKMNVLYIGVENPVSATVSGAQPGSITLSGPGLRSTGAGKGIVTPSAIGEITLTVSGKTSDGKTVSTKQPFRVKGLPKPEATIRGKSVLSMPASSLANQTVVAKMPDDFGFNLSVSVTSFSVKVPGKAAQTISGSNLGAASSVKGAKPGTTVTIFDIKTTSSVPLRPASNNVVIEVQ